MILNGARIIVESLKKEGVKYIFGYPGGAVIPLFDELFINGKELKLVSPRHEQGATHMADGYARSTGDVGVVMVTSGPGATNTVTGIATAYMDSVPLVVITGQVSTSMIGSDAFQEIDIIGITIPITKANFLVKDVNDLAYTIKHAFHLAKTGRPGPVLIDIPVDVQKAETEFIYPKQTDIKSYRPKKHGHPKQIKAAIELLKKAHRPILLVGGGCVISDAREEILKFIDKVKVPVLATLMGRGVVPSDHPLYFGGLGMHGTFYGNKAAQKADLIIALGVRFSDRITGNAKKFATDAKVIHIDIDPAEIGKNVPVDIPIVGDIKNVMQEFNKVLDFKIEYKEWLDKIRGEKIKYPLTYKKDNGLKPQYLIELASKYFPKDRIVISDVGQNQMWVAQFFDMYYPKSFLTSGGLGTMGYALPAGIGAKVGNPDKEVLIVSGDGGFQMNIQELMTIARYNFAVKILVLDNNYLGMVRQWQELFYGKRYSATEMHDNPDFAKLAEIIGIKSVKLDNPDDAEKVMKEFAESKESMLIHAYVEKEENVMPMVPPGATLADTMSV